MTCIMMGKHYIKTGVNVKNGIFQLTSASRRAAFETCIRQMVAPFHIFSKFNVRGSFKLSTGGWPSYSRGPSCPRLPYLGECHNMIQDGHRFHGNEMMLGNFCFVFSH